MGLQLEGMKKSLGYRTASCKELPNAHKMNIKTQNIIPQYIVHPKEKMKIYCKMKESKNILRKSTAVLMDNLMQKKVFEKEINDQKYKEYMSKYHKKNIIKGGEYGFAWRKRRSIGEMKNTFGVMEGMHIHKWGSEMNSPVNPMQIQRPTTARRAPTTTEITPKGHPKCRFPNSPEGTIEEARSNKNKWGTLNSIVKNIPSISNTGGSTIANTVTTTEEGQKHLHHNSPETSGMKKFRVCIKDMETNAIYKTNTKYNNSLDSNAHRKHAKGVSVGGNNNMWNPQLANYKNIPQLDISDIGREVEHSVDLTDFQDLLDVI